MNIKMEDKGRQPWDLLSFFSSRPFSLNRFDLLTVFVRESKRSDSLSCLNLFMHLDWIERKMWDFVSLDDVSLFLLITLLFPHECFLVSA